MLQPLFKQTIACVSTILCAIMLQAQDTTLTRLDSSLMQLDTAFRDLNSVFIYNLASPNATFKLDNELREISGLTYANGRLIAVQDEKGKIFMLNPVTGKIIEEHKFWSAGDFEGIVVVGQYLYVLKSNGNIYQTPLDKPDEDLTVKYDLGFGSGWNFEGITYLPQGEKLLIATKKRPGSSDKEIFGLPIDDPLAIGNPEIILDPAVLWDKLKETKRTWAERVAHSLSTLNYSFNPSGLAVHPVNGEIYVLSSPMPQLAIFTPDWELRKVLALDSKVFRQPESICFDDQLNLYIGNEGQSGTARILKFAPQ